MGASHSVSLSGTLDPLPPALQHGLPAVAFFGLLSLTSSCMLFAFLTYRLLSWYRTNQIRHGANQFFVLIYNLLLADIQQAMAFALTTVYVARNKIEIGTTTMLGKRVVRERWRLGFWRLHLLIALHTFFTVVKGRTISNKMFYIWLAGSWTFVYAMAIATVGVLDEDYVRAGAWCWVDAKHEKVRFWLHYVWIFIAMIGTVIIYALIYLSMTSRHITPSPTARVDDTSTKRAAKYMILYPIVYVLCTLPLAGGRMAAMTGIRVPYWYYCVSGAAITSCGWLDVLLYDLTRRVMLFSKDALAKGVYGLNTFGWFHGNNFYGTTTTIEGPLSHKKRRDGSCHATAKRGSSVTRPLRRQQSDEDYFATPQEGIIQTKTTVEVTSGPIHGYAASENSVLELLEDDSGVVSPSPSR